MKTQETGMFTFGLMECVVGNFFTVRVLIGPQLIIVVKSSYHEVWTILIYFLVLFPN